MINPSLQEWRSLYRAALEFRDIESWNWMLDSDVFGVQNPETSEIGYCCVMGKAGQMFGMAVYLGTEGLYTYLMMQSGEMPTYIIDALMLQKCLMVSYEDREVLQKRDLEVIKRLGLKLRGRNSWPLFRSYLPGYHPWYLTKDETRYLTLALEQAREVALRFRENPDMLISPKKGYYFVRVAEKKRGGLEWKDQWLKPQPLKEEKAPPEPVDEIRLHKLKKISSPEGVWEMDFFYHPVGVQEKGGRPYYPYVILCSDHYSGFIINVHLAKPWEYRSVFPEQFIRVMETLKALPGEVLVAKEELFDLLEPITSRLGINLRLVERLAAVESARASMYQLFGE